MTNIKFMELLSIINDCNKTFLHIRIYSETTFNVYWEIDMNTAASLQHLFDRNGHEKYRLSMHSALDTTSQHIQSSITKTYRDNSKISTFICSRDYSTQLDLIRVCGQSTDIYRLPFIHSTLKQEAPNKGVISLPKSTMKHSFNAKFSWIATAVSLTFFIIFTSSQHYATSVNSEQAQHITAKIPILQVNNLIHTSQDILRQTKTSSLISDNSAITSIYTSNQVEPVHAITTSNVIDNSQTIDSTLDSIPSKEIDLPSITIDEALTYSIPEGYVALTFDDGPSAYTIDIVDILNQYQVGSTFFFLGSSASKRPESVKYAYDHGYAIANHSMTHANLTLLNSEKLEAEITSSTLALEQIINDKITLFRPPYGALNKKVKEYVLNTNLNIIQWNNDPKDWESRDADKIVEHIKNTKTSGSIILFHETEAIVEALPHIIELLLEQNLSIVNLK